MEVLMDQEAIEKRKAYVSEYWKRRRREDPEYAEKRRAYQRERMKAYWQKRKNDPGWMEQYREKRRQYYKNREKPKAWGKKKN